MCVWLFVCARVCKARESKSVSVLMLSSSRLLCCTVCVCFSSGDGDLSLIPVSCPHKMCITASTSPVYHTTMLPYQRIVNGMNSEWQCSLIGDHVAQIMNQLQKSLPLQSLRNNRCLVRWRVCRIDTSLSQHIWHVTTVWPCWALRLLSHRRECPATTECESPKDALNLFGWTVKKEKGTWKENSTFTL